MTKQYILLYSVMLWSPWYPLINMLIPYVSYMYKHCITQEGCPVSIVDNFPLCCVPVSTARHSTASCPRQFNSHIPRLLDQLCMHHYIHTPAAQAVDVTMQHHPVSTQTMGGWSSQCQSTLHACYLHVRCS